MATILFRDMMQLRLETKFQISILLPSTVILQRSK